MNTKFEPTKVSLFKKLIYQRGGCILDANCISQGWGWGRAEQPFKAKPNKLGGVGTRVEETSWVLQTCVSNQSCSLSGLLSVKYVSGFLDNLAWIEISQSEPL